MNIVHNTAGDAFCLICVNFSKRGFFYEAPAIINEMKSGYYSKDSKSLSSHRLDVNHNLKDRHLKTNEMVF